MSAKLYLFKANQYVQIDAATMTADPINPRSIADDWNGLKQLGFDQDIDAAAYIPQQGALFFFKGKLYVKYDITADKVVGTSETIASLFKNLPAGFDDNLAAVDYDVVDGYGQVWIFKGEGCALFDPGSLTWEGYAPSNATAWLGLPSSFSGTIQESVQYGAWYFFSGSSLATFGGGGTVTPITSVFKGVEAYGFDSNIQAAISLPLEKKSTKTPPPEVNILTVLDTRTIMKNYAGKISTDQSSPTVLADKVEYFFVTGAKSVTSAQAASALSFRVDTGDVVNFRATSIDGNSENAVIVYNIAHESGDSVFHDFAPDLVTLSKAAVPDLSTVDGMPAITAPLHFSSFHSTVKSPGTETAYIDFALYQLSSDGEGQNLVGYLRRQLTIQVT